MSDNDEEMPVPFLDLACAFRANEKAWLSRIREIGASGCFILGQEVAAFEREFARYMGIKHAVAVASGTDALVLGLRALGIGPGDEVITTPYSFFASSEAISMVGAIPVFADIDRNSFTIDPHRITEKIGARTRAILPVHIFGHACDMAAILKIARAHGLVVIEDCAQAFGAKSNGEYVGALGDCKVLGCYGDGGMLTSNDDGIQEHVRRLRNHGMVASYMHAEFGCNSRLDEIQAAALRLKLQCINDDINARRKIAAQYARLLSGLELAIPQSPDAESHVYGVYTIRLKNRDAVRRSLAERRISTAVYYPLGLHLQEVYRGLGYATGSMPVCERMTAENLSLPIYPGMPQRHIERVCNALNGAVQ